MEGGHIGRMKRIKAFQAKNAQAAGNTGNTTKKWNTTSMTDDEVGTRNPKLKTALQIQANRRTGKTATTDKTDTTDKTATTQKGKSPWKNPEGFEAEFQASGTGKAGDTFEAMKTPSKKRKLPQSLRSAGKTGKRRARAKDRERAIEKKPKTKKTTKTKNQKDLEAAYGSPKDTKRMMKGKNLKESWGSKLSKKFRKGK